MSTDMPSGRPGGNGRRRRRRELLAGAAGAIGVIAAETVARAVPAQAANGDPVLQGSDNGPATRRTMVFTANNTEFASLADPDTSGKGSLGVYGHGQQAGVYGEAVRGVGVIGNGGGDGFGVQGNGAGVGAGVFGLGGPNGGFGVTAIGFIGVQGSSPAADGIGVRAANSAGGVAFEAAGPAVFSRSGSLTISAGKSTVTQTGVALTTASLVLATLQQNRAGIFVQAAVPNVSGSSFTIHLNKAVSGNTSVAWFIVN